MLPGYVLAHVQYSVVRLLQYENPLGPLPIILIAERWHRVSLLILYLGKRSVPRLVDILVVMFRYYSTGRKLEFAVRLQTQKLLRLLTKNPIIFTACRVLRVNLVQNQRGVHHGSQKAIKAQLVSLPMVVVPFLP